MSIEITGLDKLKSQIEVCLQSLTNMNSLYEKIEEELNVEIEEAISTQTSPTTGQAYKQLTQATMELQNKNSRPALYSRTLGGMPKANLTLLGSNDAMISTNLPYGEVHQFGNPNNKIFGMKKAPIPARPFMPIKKDGSFTQKFTDKLNQIIDEWINKKLNEVE